MAIIIIDNGIEMDEMAGPMACCLSVSSAFR